MIGSVVGILLILAAAPFAVYYCVKLGTYAYLQAHDLFRREQTISSLEYEEYQRGQSQSERNEEA